MKKFITVTFFCFSVLNSFAQKAGIGTTAFFPRLHVQTTVRCLVQMEKWLKHPAIYPQRGGRRMM